MTGKANVDPLAGCNPRTLPVIAVDVSFQYPGQVK